MDSSQPSHPGNHSVDLLRQLKAKGLPKPPDVPQELWDQATPYQGDGSTSSLYRQLQERMAGTPAKELPTSRQALLETFFEPAVATVLEIILDPSAKAGDKLAASKLLIEYAQGKPEQKVQHTGSLAMEVHQNTTQIVEAIKQGTMVLDVDNLLAKPAPAVENFLSKNMPQRYVVGKKATSEEK